MFRRDLLSFFAPEVLRLAEKYNTLRNYASIAKKGNDNLMQLLGLKGSGTTMYHLKCDLVFK